MVFANVPSKIVFIDMVGTTGNYTSTCRNTAFVEFEFVRSHGSSAFLTDDLFVVLAHDLPQNSNSINFSPNYNC